MCFSTATADQQECPPLRYAATQLVDSCADSGRGLEAVVHVNVKIVEHTARWLENYELQSLVTLRVARKL